MARAKTKEKATTTTDDVVVVEKSSKKINGNTIVRIFNNTSGGVSFKSVNGTWVRLRNKGYKDVTYSDLENLYNEYPRMLNSGVIFIAWQQVREKLGLDYENIFALKDIKELLELPQPELFSKLQNAPRPLQAEVAQYAIHNINELTVGVINTIQDATKISIVDFKYE